VAVFSSTWAENQARSFVSQEANPALHQVLQGGKGMAQLVQINIEDNRLKRWLVKMFMGSLRKRIGEANWDKYFLVPRAVTYEIQEAVGLLNSKVGYIYLVDSQCRIRWAGSGASKPDERESLAKGVQRLLDDMSKEEVVPEAPTTEKANGLGIGSKPRVDI